MHLCVFIDFKPSCHFDIWNANSRDSFHESESKSNISLHDIFFHWRHPPHDRHQFRTNSAHQQQLFPQLLNRIQKLLPHLRFSLGHNVHDTVHGLSDYSNAIHFHLRVQFHIVHPSQFHLAENDRRKTFEGQIIKFTISIEPSSEVPGSILHRLWNCQYVCRHD